MRGLGDDAVAVLPAAPVRLRNGDVEYGYRQGSDFWYLTGFEEPDAVAVLAPGRPDGEYVLFCRPRDRLREQWDGPRAGTVGAVADFGADEAFPVDELDARLPGLLAGRTQLVCTLGRDARFDARVHAAIERAAPRARQSGPAAAAPREIAAPEPVLHEMRLTKSRAELAALARSAEIAVAAHRRAMRFARPGRTEYEVAAELLHEFHRHGVETSYPPIVGGGANACILHYRANAAPLADGDLLLIDSGCEYRGYASDITRTFPANGRFTPAQRDLYEVVLEAQAEAIGRCRPGNDWNDPHEAAVLALTRGLVRLGLLSGRVPSLVKSGAYREFYPHRTGHWLGLDVHDAGDYRVGERWRRLAPGMVLTVEPGLYVAPRARAPKAFRGLGIRIEDDVAITRGAPDVLTGALVKDPDEVERWMAAA
jgi:Xaa-Pro aminopeptidase